MFVKVLGSYSDTAEVGLPSIAEVHPYGDKTKILTQNDREYWSAHPVDVVRKALTLFAGLLSGREEMQIPFPLSNPVPEPQSLNGWCLDLTKNQIELTEESAPIDAKGNIQLNAMQTHVRILSYDQKPGSNKSEQDAPKIPQLGQMILGKGIFAGVWTPKDRDGKSLGKAFNVYAAPEDLTDESGKKALLTFKDTAKRITALRNWHGHDGGNFPNDTALYEGLRNGSAVGKWFIPTRDLLTDNLYANKDTGDLKGTFATNGSGLDVWYWSCTEHRDHTSFVWNTRFSDGGDDWHGIDNPRLSCRPCRVEALSI